MEFEAIELHHRARIDDIRKRYRSAASSHAFLPLFLWRKEMGFSLFFGEDFFVVRSLWKGENSYYFPCGARDGAARFIESRMSSPGFKLCYMRRDDAVFLERVFPGSFSIKPDRDSAEYLYDRAEQIAMRGKKYARLRLQIHRLERVYRLVTADVTSRNLDDARSVTADWYSCRPARPPEAGFDDSGITAEMLENREELNLTGILVYVDDAARSVQMGGFIGADTFDLGMGKTIRGFPGLDFYAKRALYERLPGECRTINREEDLGLEGLRASKLAAHPCALNEFWEGTAANE
jgi:hypothetical protein